ncbi:MAG: radical SAM protein [Acidobacteriota bacterium]|nr:radical SAM protein [Acidobacteriota bacterium]
MKILLIDPPFHRFMGFYRYFFPYGLSSIAAALDKSRHEILIYDVDHGEKPVAMTSSDLLRVFPRYIEGIRDTGHLIWREVEQVMASFRPDLVGITFMSTKMGAVAGIVDISKRLFPQVPVILGGDHPTVLYEATLRKLKADAAVIGEGERTFAEIVRRIESGRTDFEGIPGLAVRKPDGEIALSPPRPLIEDIDTLAFPDRESLHKLDTYRPDDLSMIMTSRGCPFHCAFCSSIWERRVRNRSIPHIMREITYLVERFGTRNLYFKDDTFTVDRRRVREFCRAIKDSRLDVRWECLTRIELVDPEILEEMREAGMIYLKIGIETGSPRILKDTGKNLTLEQIRRGARILREAGQKWSAFFMIGYPDETEEDIRMSRDLIGEIRPTYVSMSTLVPYPGCRYYYDLEKDGLIGEDSDWNLYDPFSLETHFTRRIGRERFRELVIDTMAFIDDYNAAASSAPTASG